MIASIFWLARNAQADSVGTRAITIGGVVLAVTGLIATVIDMIIAKPNAVIWLNIVLFAFFGVFFAILAFKKA